jgi:hypothetical protein
VPGHGVPLQPVFRRAAAKANHGFRHPPLPYGRHRCPGGAG